MGKINPSDIVKYAQIALNANWGYIWGTDGEMWTAEKQAAVDRDPKGREQTKKYGKKWIGHNVADCSGLLKWIFRQLGMKLPHGSNSQYMKYCDAKGEINKDTVLVPGCGVFKYDPSLENPYYHVGVYIGNGKVIEAQGTYKGVVQSGLFGWSHYGYWKNVDWGKSTMDILQKGSRGGAVALLQTRLNALGYDCGAADGIFGDKTDAAVRAFQAANDLPRDGIVGEATWNALNAASTTPAPQQPTTPTDIPIIPMPVTPVMPEFVTLSQAQYTACIQARDLLIAALGNG